VVVSGRRSLFTFPAGRRAKWVVFAIWFVAIFIAAGPAQLPTKFTDAEENESTSFLPGDAESTTALTATEELQGGELAPAVIVFRRESGLTAADRRLILEDVAKLAQTRFEGVVPDGATAANLVVAYEPVWAIGTGLTPTTADVEQVHKFIRGVLSDRFKAEGAGMRILYGGSVKPANAKELLAVANVNGALVGGASLKATDFLGIAAGC